MKTIVILGMHRSGTSCLTGCLQQMGLHLGNVSEANKYNKKGNRENKNIFQLNESILNFNGGSWHNIPSTLIWKDEHIIKQKLLIHDVLKQGNPNGFKDPRMLIVFPFWEKAFNSFEIVGTFRHPISVAKSLKARKNLSIPYEKGLNLWYSYNKRLLKYHDKYNFDIINFDVSEKQYKENIITIAKNLGLNYNLKVLSFFDGRLRSQKEFKEKESNLPKQITFLYKELKKISENTK